MRETVEFRIPEIHAREVLAANEGTLIAGIAREYTVATSDPRFLEIGRVERDFRSKGRAFFTGWEIRRRYSERELARAELLRLIITLTFEPAGEECGTVYDDSQACPHCGAGGRQKSPLRLDAKRIPRHADISKTIAEEVIVSHVFRDLIDRHGMTGVSFSRGMMRLVISSQTLVSWTSHRSVLRTGSSRPAQSRR